MTKKKEDGQVGNTDTAAGTAAAAEIEKKKKIDICMKAIQNKSGKGSIMLLGAQPVERIPVTSTGVFPIDAALTIGGIPKGRICEFFGPEGGGKTTVALYSIAACQKAGGTAAFLDVEHALDPNLAISCGVRLEELLFSQPDNANQMLTIVEQLIKSDVVSLIVIDSVAAMTTEAEMNDILGEGTPKIGELARLMSLSLKKLATLASQHGTTLIFINQIRNAISPNSYSHGPTETTPGGKALKFYSSVRLEIRRGKQIKKGEEVIGHELFVKVVKNKMAPPFKTAHCSLIYGDGIPEDLCIVDTALDKEILAYKGSWIVYAGRTLAQGKGALAKMLGEDTGLKEQIKKDILEQAWQYRRGSDTDIGDVGEGEAAEDVREIPQEIPEDGGNCGDII